MVIHIIVEIQLLIGDFKNLLEILYTNAALGMIDNSCIIHTPKKFVLDIKYAGICIK